jgi:uncharacterized repeat protein (TIGR01451 family)
VTGHASSTLADLGNVPNGNPAGPITVQTDGTGLNGSDAVKTFVNARIHIGPDAVNEVGKSHTFTVLVEKNLGGVAGWQPAGGEPVTVTLTDHNGSHVAVSSNSCASGTGAGGTCAVSFTSLVAGQVTGHASSTLADLGNVPNGNPAGPITVQTDGTGLNGSDATKSFVDANIQISPLLATNPVGKSHTLTGHVNVNAGAGAGFVSAPAGTVIVFSLTNSGGASAAFVGPASCSTVGSSGSCSVVIVSAATGSTSIKAATDVSVAGVVLHRETDGSGANSVAASKLWADSTVRTDILNSAGVVVTSVVAGTVVHDRVQVAKAAGTPASVPAPTGTVVFHRFATLDCSGAAAANQSVALTPGAPSTAVSDDFAPVGNISYQAEYQGDVNYPAHTGACEPLTVTPVPNPAIAIVKNPKSQTVAVGGRATFQITVTNVGNVTLTDVHVVDPLSPNCNRTQAQIPALASMAPAATVTYSCTRPNVQRAFNNVATAIGTPPSGPDVTATDSAPVKVRALKPPPVKKKKPKVISHKKPKATG